MLQGKIITLKDGEYNISFPYDPDLVLAVKALPKRKYNPASKVWSAPSQPDNDEAVVRFAADNGFSLAPEIAEWVKAQAEQRRDNLVKSRALVTTFDVQGLGGTLRPFQRVGVEYAARAERTFIADDTGLGKTVEALATLYVTQAYPAIIVCQSTKKLDWAAESRKWTPERTVSIWTNGSQRPADVVVINYDIVVDNLDALHALKAKGLVCDESQHLKTGNAQRTEAVLELATGVHSEKEKGYKAVRTVVGEPIPIRLLLSATVTMNRPSELMSQLSILDRLKDFGGFWQFATYFCSAQKTRFGWDFSGAAHLDELNEKLRQISYIRRLKGEVHKELPVKQRSMVHLEIDNRGKYEAAAADLISYIRNKAATDRAFQASIAGLPEQQQRWLIQERADEAGARAEQAEHLVRIEALKQLAVSGKMEQVKEWVADFLDTGEKLILFAWHVDVVMELASYFHAPYIKGGDSDEYRQSVKNAFQTNPEVKLVVCNIQAGGTGLDLTAAKNVAFVEFAWTPAAHDQAEDRCYGRENDPHGANCWYFCADSTIDDDIYELIEAKRLVVTAVNEGVKGAKPPDVNILNDLIKRLVKEAPSAEPPQERPAWTDPRPLALPEWTDAEIIEGLLAMYLRQTEDERVGHGTRWENGIGYNGVDAEFGTSLAEQIHLGKTLSERQIHAARRMLVKYQTQLGWE